MAGTNSFRPIALSGALTTQGMGRRHCRFTQGRSCCGCRGGDDMSLDTLDQKTVDSLPYLSDVYDAYGVQVNALSVSEIFALYEHTGFLYPDKARVFVESKDFADRQRNLCSLRTHGLSVSGQSGTPFSAPHTGSGKLATDVECRRIAALCVDLWRQEARAGVACSLADHAKRLDVTAPCL